jgi:hypothetical protein
MNLGPERIDVDYTTWQSTQDKVEVYKAITAILLFSLVGTGAICYSWGTTAAKTITTIQPVDRVVVKEVPKIVEKVVEKTLPYPDCDPDQVQMCKTLVLETKDVTELCSKGGHDKLTAEQWTGNWKDYQDLMKFPLKLRLEARRQLGL